MRYRSYLEELSYEIKDKKEKEAQRTLESLIKQREGIKPKQNLNKPLFIYIAGPYTPYNSDPHSAARIAHENTIKALNIGIDVADKGHIPYIPHLSHFIHLYGKKELPYEYYTKTDISWLEKCDAILFYDHKIGKSKGADKELAFAIDTGKMIFFSINEIPPYV